MEKRQDSFYRWICAGRYDRKTDAVFYSLKPEDLSDVDSFLEKGMPYTEVNKITKQSDALTAFFRE